MERQKVSVIVPVYNVEKYIGRCLDSIRNQSYQNLEILVVNDGSTDKSPEICLKHAGLDKRIVYITQDNRGLACARNRALAVMTGDYVICVDSDDFIRADMVETLLQTAVEEKADLVSCDYHMVDDNDYPVFLGENTAKQKMQTTELARIEALRKLLLPESRYCSAWGKLYAKQLWRDCLRYPEGNRFGEDMYVAHILIDRAGRIVHIHCPMYYYNQSGTSLVRSGFNRNKLNLLEAIKNWIDFFDEKYPQLTAQSRGFYYTYLINFFAVFLDGNERELYFQYKAELKNAVFLILKNKYIGNRDKLKALLILCVPADTYKTIRKRLT